VETESRKNVIHNTDPPNRHAADPHCETVAEQAPKSKTGWQNGRKRKKEKERKKGEGE
jgi:hypothetical protein